MNDNKKDYMIDVASERTYQNQSDDYAKAYTKWRNNPDNSYAYRFVHDSREHIYIDGEGFADKVAVTAEKSALHCCLQFTGILMMIMLAIQCAQYFFSYLIFDNPYYGWTYYSELGDGMVLETAQVIFHCTTILVIPITLIIICIKVLKIPREVCLPHEKVSGSFLFSAVVIALLYLVMSRCFDYALMNIFAAVNLDITFYSFPIIKEPLAQCIYYLTELIIFPILGEVLLRGYILQLFRQFGDLFALFVSAFLGAVFYHDITKLFYIFVLGLLLGFITIKSGSLLSSVITRLVVVNLSFFLNTISSDSSNLPLRLVEVVVSLVIVFSAFAVLFTMSKRGTNWLKLDTDETELSMSDKMRLMLNSPWLVVFLVVDLFVVIFSVRLL